MAVIHFDSLNFVIMHVKSVRSTAKRSIYSDQGIEVAAPMLFTQLFSVIGSAARGKCLMSA